MNDTPRRTLCTLIEEHGKSLCDDPRRCEALLRDLCPEFRREIFLLVSALHERVPQRLLGSHSGMPIEAMIKRSSKRLCERLGLTDDLALWAVETWALALGLVTPEAVEVIHFVCPKCGLSGNIGQKHAGRKVTCRDCHSLVRVSKDGKRFALVARSGRNKPRSKPRPVPGRSMSAEDLLRQALYVAVADGQIVAMESIMLESLRRRLGISAQDANQVLTEVLAEGGQTVRGAKETLFTDWGRMSVRPDKSSLMRAPATSAGYRTRSSARIGAVYGAVVGMLPGFLAGAAASPYFDLDGNPGIGLGVGVVAAALIGAVYLHVTGKVVTGIIGGCVEVVAVVIGGAVGLGLFAIGGTVAVGIGAGAVLGGLLGAGAGALFSSVGNPPRP